jgi:hypothetical protein
MKSRRMKTNKNNCVIPGGYVMKKQFLLFSFLIVFFSFALSACKENFEFPDRPGPEVPEFIPVEKIIGIPTGSLPYLEITLSGTVMPANATNKRTAWSIKEDGGTNSTLERNKLTADEYGTVTVTATIKNGLGENEDYTEDFDIVISASMVAVTSVEGIPETVLVGDYALNGRVRPSNALNKTIVWTVSEDDPGTTGASIYGNILTTASPGTAVITATVANGRLDGDYTRDFSINIFSPVMDIEGIPANVLIGGYELNGAVVPHNASNTAIVWAVKDAGETGATIVSGEILSTSAAGTVKIGRASCRERVWNCV